MTWSTLSRLARVCLPCLLTVREALLSTKLTSVSGVLTNTTLGTQTGGSMTPARPCGDWVMVDLVSTENLDTSLVLLSLAAVLGGARCSCYRITASFY